MAFKKIKSELHIDSENHPALQKTIYEDNSENPDVESKSWIRVKDNGVYVKNPDADDEFKVTNSDGGGGTVTEVTSNDFDVTEGTTTPNIAIKTQDGNSSVSISDGKFDVNIDNTTIKKNATTGILSSTDTTYTASNGINIDVNNNITPLTQSPATDANKIATMNEINTTSVTQIKAGSNITIDPTTGVGEVTINATGGGGPDPNKADKYNPGEDEINFPDLFKHLTDEEITPGEFLIIGNKTETGATFKLLVPTDRTKSYILTYNGGVGLL